MTDAPRKRGLGRGLSALFGDEVAETTAPAENAGPSRLAGVAAVDVPVEHLSSGRFQPRMDFDEEALQDLSDSIRVKGVLQPILVRRLPEDQDRYEIIAGERRWRAAQMAQVHNVPVLIRDFSDQEAAEVALIENLQRRDLNPLEEAEGYKRLMDEFQRSQEEVAQALGKSRSHLANMVRLLNLPMPVKTMLRTGQLSAGHARALLNATDPVVLAEQVVKKGLNVRQTERLATEKGGVKQRKARASAEKDADTLALERDLSNLLGLKVAIEFQGRGGQVVLHYDTLEQLDDILYRLNAPTDNAADTRREDRVIPLQADEDPLSEDDDLSDLMIGEDSEEIGGTEGEGAVEAHGEDDGMGSHAFARALTDAISEEPVSEGFGEAQVTDEESDIDAEAVDEEALFEASVDAWAADLAETTARENEEMLNDTLDASDEDGDLDIDETLRSANN